MSNGITLTSAMRNNLGALKYLSGQMDITQTRLATGQKVNSAIDNASSFYQARALTNRASDLDRLLDSMGQSIQTINAAISGLEHAGATLEQAAVVAQQAYEAAIIPEKAWFEAQVGENGAVVSTAQELKDAIAANKETICVYGKIDLGEITSTISLKNNQKLVGIGYFGDFDSELNKFSKLTAELINNKSLFSVDGNNEFNDLDISVRQNQSTISWNHGIILVNGNLRINNINILAKDTASYIDRGVFRVSGGNLELAGKINMLAKGDGRTCIVSNDYSDISIADNAQITVVTGSHSGMTYTFDSNVTIGNNVKILLQDGNMINNYTGGIGDYVIKSGTIFYGNSSKLYRQAGNVSITIEKDVILAFKNGNSIDFYRTKKDFEWVQQENAIKYLTKTDISANNEYFEEITYDLNLSSLEELQSYDTSEYNDIYSLRNGEAISAQLSNQYLSMMSAYDDMIKDSSYQGINLLTGGNMTTMFNETRSNSFKVEGANMTAESLGITTREWQTKEDIAQSIKEIKDAMYKVRDMVESLGNNLSIIETRMNFTDALTDILQIGADELVLADMNEESANYLALQTRQQLAVNALSLAAQSSSAVLKLF